MKFFMHTKIGLFIASLIAVLIFSATFTGCQAEPAQAKAPTATAESYFQHPAPPEPYNPCKDSWLKYERGIEGEQRKKECGVE